MSGQQEMQQQLAKFQELAKVDFEGAKRVLSQLKLALATNGSAQTPEQIALERSVFETAAMLNIREKDIKEFQRHFSMLKPYYVDYGSELPPSDLQSTVLGLNLLRLLAQGSLDEFHIELETISSEHLSSPAVQFPVQLEQLSMEGSYHKVVHFQQQLPSPEYSVFMDTLSGTLRDEIASCCEKAYKDLPCAKAAEMLWMDANSLGAYCEERGWVIKGDRIDFATDSVEKNEVSVRTGRGDCDVGTCDGTH
jgi:26S proteasome regulatory subunit N12